MTETQLKEAVDLIEALAHVQCAVHKLDCLPDAIREEIATEGLNLSSKIFDQIPEGLRDAAASKFFEERNQAEEMK